MLTWQTSMYLLFFCFCFTSFHLEHVINFNFFPPKPWNICNNRLNYPDNNHTTKFLILPNPTMNLWGVRRLSRRWPYYRNDVLKHGSSPWLLTPLHANKIHDFTSGPTMCLVGRLTTVQFQHQQIEIHQLLSTILGDRHAEYNSQKKFLPIFYILPYSGFIS